jgi:uncharacterized RDD family membrane protein YckC
MTQPPPLPENPRRPPPLPLVAPPPPLPVYNPYSAPLAAVEQPIEQGELELADRGARLGAYLLDSVIFFGVVMLLLPVTALMEKAGDAGSAIGGLLMVAAIIGLIAVNLVMLHRQGQTLGKRIVGIRILRIDGSRCELWRIIVLRVFAIGLLQLIPLIGWIFFLVDALMIFGDERRCLHDIFADTMVVKA